MPRLINLTNVDGDVIYINPNYVEAIRPSRNGGCVVYTCDNSFSVTNLPMLVALLVEVDDADADKEPPEKGDWKPVVGTNCYWLGDEVEVLALKEDEDGEDVAVVWDINGRYAESVFFESLTERKRGG